MNRLALVIGLSVLCVSGAAFGQSSRSQSASSRGAYDPFAMQRAAAAPAGSADRNKFENRQKIVKYLKSKVKPPKPHRPKSPHKPGDGNNGHGNDDDHDDDSNPGQGNGGHGQDNDDNGHGNDDDRDDDSNPGRGRGNPRRR